jgi:hypothetical protein
MRLRLYPGAKVLAARSPTSSAKNRRRCSPRSPPATGTWSSSPFVVRLHRHSPETEQRFLDEELRIAQDAIKEAEEAGGGQGFSGWRKPFTVKEAERLVTSIKPGWTSSKNARKRDRLLTFEQMGVDDLTVDEAHEFKNLFYSSRLTDVRGMGNKAGSQEGLRPLQQGEGAGESPTKGHRHVPDRHADLQQRRRNVHDDALPRGQGTEGARPRALRRLALAVVASRSGSRPNRAA